MKMYFLSFPTFYKSIKGLPVPNCKEPSDQTIFQDLIWIRMYNYLTKTFEKGNRRGGCCNRKTDTH